MPKKLIAIVAILTFNFQLITLNCCAQPNGGFENWTPEFSYENPDGWATFNFLSLMSPPNPLSAFKAIGIDKHSGNYSLKLKTIFVNNNPWPAQIRYTVSGIFTGRITPSPFSYDYGFPYTGRPAKLEFWAKYAPIGNDTAGAAIILFKWNGVKEDTIVFDNISIPATTIFTLFQLNLNYYSTLLPDSASISFASSKGYDIARVNSTLFIDDVSLTGWVGIDQYNQNSDKVKVFPTPAKDYVSILAQIEDADNVKVIDVSGKCAGIYKIQNYSTTLNTSLFSPGTYFFEVQDKKEKVLSTGKFSVVK